MAYPLSTSINPALLAPVRETAGTMEEAAGPARGVISTGTEPANGSPATRAPRLPLGGRSNMSGWARWKQGRRMPAPPVASDGSGGRGCI